MDEVTLRKILAENYGNENASLEFLREGGSHTYLVNGETKYLLKPKVPSFYTKDYVGTGTSISS